MADSDTGGGSAVAATLPDAAGGRADDRGTERPRYRVFLAQPPPPAKRPVGADVDTAYGYAAVSTPIQAPTAAVYDMPLGTDTADTADTAHEYAAVPTPLQARSLHTGHGSAVHLVMQEGEAGVQFDQQQEEAQYAAVDYSAVAERSVRPSVYGPVSDPASEQLERPAPSPTPLGAHDQHRQRDAQYAEPDDYSGVDAGPVPNGVSSDPVSDQRASSPPYGVFLTLPTSAANAYESDAAPSPAAAVYDMPLGAEAAYEYDTAAENAGTAAGPVDGGSTVANDACQETDGRNEGAGYASSADAVPQAVHGRFSGKLRAGAANGPHGAPHGHADALPTDVAVPRKHHGGGFAARSVPLADGCDGAAPAADATADTTVVGGDVYQQTAVRHFGGPIFTILTALSWVCVVRRRALPFPSCTWNRLMWC